IKSDCRKIRFHAAKITFFSFNSILSGNHGMTGGIQGNHSLPLPAATGGLENQVLFVTLHKTRMTEMYSTCI
ncbi:MAG: hypothetical protein K2L57_04550, partial [Muribaculaceae bacterium]|nr:hypothetical protein [Muribaculaceae bacterium]